VNNPVTLEQNAIRLQVAMDETARVQVLHLNNNFSNDDANSHVTAQQRR
jgi:hypothetical protein